MGKGWPTNEKTIRVWNQVYRVNEIIPRNCYPNRNKLPPLLIDNPDLCKKMKRYGRTHLDGLSVEKMHHHLYHNLITKIALNHKTATKHDDDDDDNDEDIDKILNDKGKKKKWGRKR